MSPANMRTSNSLLYTSSTTMGFSISGSSSSSSLNFSFVTAFALLYLVSASASPSSTPTTSTTTTLSHPTHYQLEEVVLAVNVQQQQQEEEKKEEMKEVSGGGGVMESLVLNRWSRRRRLGGLGSSPPTCRGKCGRCSPCKAVHVPIQPGRSMPLEYYPEAWRCKCGNKIFMP